MAEKDLTQGKLAKAINSRQGAVSAWLNGKNRIMANKLMELCDILGLEPRELYNAMYMNSPKAKH